MRYKSVKEKGNRPGNKIEHFQKKHINKTTKTPLAQRFQTLEDEETGWGRDIRQLMGVYRKRHDGSCCLEDIRKPDLTKILKYPKTTFNVSPLTLSKPIEGLETGQYCLFNWKFTFKEKVNPCEIEVDESKPIVFISPKDFITAIEKVQSKPEETASEDKPSIQKDVCVLIYDLLHEANKYCGKTVDAQFYLTDKYLSFQHTGLALNAENILNLCEQGTDRVEDPDDRIAYTCNGLREFLLSNNHTIIVSNGFTVRFDNVDGKLKVVWLEKSELPREIKISLARNKRFTETIIFPFDKNEKSLQSNYKVGLNCVFEDVQNIAFFANIGKVTIKIKGDKAKTLDRKGWITPKGYLSFVPKDVREKGIKKRHTGIMFACRHKGNVLEGEEEAPVYSLLPTASSFGFPFLMQLDVHINKTNYTINHRDPWNKAYAEIAGRLFAKWITELTLKAEYTPESIYAMVPKFDECIAEHPEEQTFIRLFQKGFKDAILSETEDKEKNKDKDRDKNKNKQGRVYVIDTNIFVNCPDIISKMGKDDTVILSAKVVDELDNLKYKLEDKDLRNVQKALKCINQALDKDNVRMEMSDVSLLPRDFDRHNPDNNILSVVIRHKAEKPTLLTSDNGLQIKAKGIGVSVIGLKEFLAEKRK